jgi:ribosomal protein L3 glutamine methyltransferase
MRRFIQPTNTTSDTTNPMNIPTQELRTLRDWIRWSTSDFTRAELYFGHGSDNPLDDALALILGTLHLQHDTSDIFLDARITTPEAELLAARIRQRVEQRTPVPYITGKAYFAGLEFIVNEHVLIPRSPIAELIKTHFSPWLNEKEPSRILDLCAGSGCIGIACAYAFPQTTIDLLDISAQALAVAEQNIAKHQLQDRINTQVSDLFDRAKNGRYDLIISNPPYVCENEMSSLPAEYLQEPPSALVAGKDGMDIISRILAEAPDYMNPDAILIAEVGANADLLQTRYPKVPFLWLDLAHGGEGVFLFTTDELAHYQPVFLEN